MVTHAAIQQLPPSVYQSIQLIADAWGDTLYGFVSTWFACRSSSWFCDPVIDRMNARARALQSTTPHAAAAIWANIDRSLADQAASLPMINERGIAFLSAGVANYQSHPYWGVMADQLWVK